MKKVFITVESENNIENTLKMMNVLSMNYSKVTNPVIGMWNANEFYLSFKIESDDEMNTISQILNANELTNTLTFNISAE